MRVPPFPPALPDRAELRPLHDPFGSLFETFADFANHLAGFQFLRVVPVIISPFVRDTNTTVAAVQTRAIRFTTSEFGRCAIVALGYSAVKAGGYVKASVREAHTTIPGAGAVIDPGCYWKRSNNDLQNPVQDHAYRPAGLRWTLTGQQYPPTISATDPVAVRPRMLKIPRSADVDLVLEWDKLKLNAVLLIEAWRANV